MGTYIDGWVVPVKKNRLKAYKRLAQKSARIWRKHGALRYVEAVADDVSWGKRTSFPRSVKLKRGEVVVFAYVTYPSRAVRDRCMKKVMKDPALADMMSMGPKQLPFDGKRMFWGGFKVFVKA